MGKQCTRNLPRCRGVYLTSLSLPILIVGAKHTQNDFTPGPAIHLG